MVQTIYDIVNANGGVSIAIGMKAETKGVVGQPDSQARTEFILQIPIL